MPPKRRRSSSGKDHFYDQRYRTSEGATVARHPDSSLDIRQGSQTQAASEHYRGSSNKRYAASSSSINHNDNKRGREQEQEFSKTSELASRARDHVSSPQRQMAPPSRRPQSTCSNPHTTARASQSHTVTERPHRISESEGELFERLRPSNTRWVTTTDEVKVNDIIFYRHGELCKDLRNSYDQEHDIVEQSEGSILYKYRWALVIAKYNRNLLVIPMTTFSNTPKSSKQKQTIFNEVTGTRESALKDYIHVVADSHPGTSEDWPGCWGNDQRVHYRSFDRDPGLKKDSFANLMMGHWVLEGTPLLIKGTIVKTASREALTMARKEAHRREEIAMDMAVEDQTGRVATREQQRELTRARIARQDQSIARHTEGQKSRLTEDIYDDPLPPPPKRTKYGDREDALDRARPCDPSQPEPTLTTQLGHTAEPRPVGNAPATAFNGLNMNTATGSRPGSS